MDSRPYELAIARTYRAPEAIDGYRAELARLGWPLSELEEAALGPVYRAFRLDMTAWQLKHGATYTPRTLILHWNGHSWKRVASPNPHSWQASAS